MDAMSNRAKSTGLVVGSDVLGGKRGKTAVIRTVGELIGPHRVGRALAIETYENWLEANRYLNMNDLKEMTKAELRQAA